MRPFPGNEMQQEGTCLWNAKNITGGVPASRIRSPNGISVSRMTDIERRTMQRVFCVVLFCFVAKGKSREAEESAHLRDVDG